MKFTTVILGLFVAFAAANPVAQPDALSQGDVVEDAKIEARQSCGRCTKGTRNCCGMGGCTQVKC